MASINDLTLEQVSEIEKLSGQPLADLGDPKAMKGRLMQAIVYTLKHSEDASFSFEQAGKLTMAQMNEVIGGDDDPLA
jgi:hypothetical protein